MEHEAAARRGRRAVAAMFLVNGFVTGSWAPQIPFLLPRHGIGEAVLGLLILLFGVGAVAAMAGAGLLIARLGSRGVLAGFALASAGALALVVLAPSLPLLAAAMFAMGAVLGSMDVAQNASAVVVERRLGRPIMSASHGFWSLGGFAGAALGGPAIGLLGPAGHALAVSGASLLLVLVALPGLPADPPAPAAGGARGRAFPRGAAVWILGLMALVAMLPEGAVLDWAALYLSRELGAGVAASGLAFAAFAGAMAAMRFAGDGLRNRFGAVGVLRVSALVAAAGLLAAALAPTAALTVGGFAVAGLGVANCVPVLFSAAGNQPGSAPGAAIAAVSMLGYSGILVAPSAIGVVAEAAGFRPTYAALALLLLGVAALAPRAAAADAARPVRPATAGAG